MADEILTCADLDERLAPYVDGEDDPTGHRAVDVHLSACPSCRSHATAETAARDLVAVQRLALCERAPAALRARCEARAGRMDSSPVAGVQPPISASRVPVSFLRKWAPLSLAATLLLAVAGVFVFGLNDHVQALAASLAVDHVKCFKVEGAGTPVDARASERAWQDDQGWPIAVPQAQPAQQLALLDVRRCFTTDGRAAHMMYTWRGEPLSVYVLQGDVGRDRIVHNMGAQTVIWCANRRTYAVVSGDTRQDLAPIVDYIKAHVQ